MRNREAFTRTRAAVARSSPRRCAPSARRSRSAWARCREQRRQARRGASHAENKLRELQADNAGKLEEMRRTVDEKLHATLEQRLGESFKLVSDRLEQVHRGLGEMQALASDVAT